MIFFITTVCAGILLAALLAPRHSTTDPASDPLGRYRLPLGAAAAAVPHLDHLLWLGGVQPVLLYQHSVLWSAYLYLPLGALLLALLRWRTRWPLQQLLPVVALPWLLTIALGALSDLGLQLYWPLSHNYIAGNLFYTGDLYLALLMLAGAVGAWLWWPYRRWLGAGVAMLLALYLGGLDHYRSRALAHAQTYIQTQALQPLRVTALPQAYAPHHWRLVVEDAQHQLHSLHLRLRESPAWLPPAADPDLFLPPHAAVWEVTPRFGKPSLHSIAQHAYVQFIDNRAFRWQLRFSAVQDVYQHAGDNCLRFRDLRQPRRPGSLTGTVLLCPPKPGLDDWAFYLPNLTHRYHRALLPRE